MLGRILGFDASNNEGAISGDNGQRYKFSKSGWKDSSQPEKELKVDFAVNEEDEAVEIYVVRDEALENTNTILGIVALAITFFFGFIGTLVSRLALAKQSLGEALIPTLIHFVITLFIFIPFIGWLVYFAGTIYYMYQNYLLTTTSKK